ncbi:MAG: roadblock/LC7 domain-containing protein [Candidatus Helarchaeota archaeon]
MGENLSEDIKHELTELLRKLESRTELEACAVVSKEGMRIACAVGAELDADVYSAASAALVNLGETTLKQLRHGTLKEIIVRGDDGYTILTSAGKAHMIVGSCKNMSRMGYYLALLHRFSNKVAGVMGYAVEAPTPSPMSVPAPAAGPTAASLLDTGDKGVAKTAPVQSSPTPTPQPTYIKTPPLSQIPVEPVKDAISEALDVLSPVDEPEPIPIEEPELITIDEPEPIPIEEPVPISPPTPADNVDKGALFEALQALGSEKEPATAAPSAKVETEALKDALKPQPATKPVPFSQQPAPSRPAAKPASVPFAAQSSTPKVGGDDDLFKISDKEAVLEALKVLGWEEPEEK